MSKKEYEKAILDALSATSQSEDPISIIRAALNSCDAGFPYGDCRGILTDLSENDFTGWRACTYDDAKKFVGEGIPTVGINDDQLVLVPLTVVKNMTIISFVKRIRLRPMKS